MILRCFAQFFSDKIVVLTRVSRVQTRFHFVRRKIKHQREFTLYHVFYDAKRCTCHLNLGGFFDVLGT